jgi:hypothetical protein
MKIKKDLFSEKFFSPLTKRLQKSRISKRPSDREIDYSIKFTCPSDMMH